MFLEKYLNEIYLGLLYDKYEEWYLKELDENKFLEIYNLFKKYNFYFVDDIIINYLELFEYSKSVVEAGICELQEMLGQSFMFKIGNNLTYLDYILEY